MSKFSILNKISATEGNQELLISILLDAAHAMTDVSNCEAYIVNISNDSSNSVFVYEVWSSEEAHKASLSLEATQQLLNKARPILAGVERISTLTPLGGKGLSLS